MGLGGAARCDEAALGGVVGEVERDFGDRCWGSRLAGFTYAGCSGIFAAVVGVVRFPRVDEIVGQHRVERRGVDFEYVAAGANKPHPPNIAHGGPLFSTKTMSGASPPFVNFFSMGVLGGSIIHNAFCMMHCIHCIVDNALCIRWNALCMMHCGLCTMHCPLCRMVDPGRAHRHLALTNKGNGMSSHLESITTSYPQLTLVIGNYTHRPAFNLK